MFVLVRLPDGPEDEAGQATELFDAVALCKELEQRDDVETAIVIRFNSERSVTDVEIATAYTTDVARDKLIVNMMQDPRGYGAA